MELRQCCDIAGRRRLDGIGPHDTGIVDDVGDAMFAGDLGGRRRGGLGIEKIDLAEVEARMRPVGLVERQRNHAMAAFEHRLGDGRTDAAARAGDDRGIVVVHARLSARGTRASTRSGLPDPCGS